MKRLVALLILLAMLPAVSFASDLEEFRLVYNYLADYYKAQNLPETYTIETSSSGGEWRVFSLSESLNVQAYVKNGEVTGFSVVCYSDDAALDFLLACEIGNFTLDSDINVDVLLNYMLACTDNGVDDWISGGYEYHMSKTIFGYLYVIVKE